MTQSYFTVARQFVLFCALGAVGTLAQYLVLVMGVELGGGPVVSSTLGFIVGAFVNYALSYRFIFCSTSFHAHTLAKFFTVAVVGLGLNTLVFSSALHNLRLHYLASQVLASSIVVGWNFAGNRWWTFQEGAYGKSR